MRRRGNKSSKVPNVKLRPADKGAYSRPIEESCWAQETQPGSDDTTVYDLCPRPMKGVVICATGVADKPTLFKQAVELGATCTPAFTDRVTYLVATDHGGAKYMCALERKIPILKPSWITENYQIWLKGDDVDVTKSVDQHRLPIFSGVVVCPSGITDITRRTQISKLVTTHDGAYLKNLERPVRVTHLLCSGDEATDKMRYAEKFNSRKEAKIHLVWEEWFWDSLDFGGRFDEATYQVRRPRPERKSLAEARSSPPPPSSDVPSQLDEPPSSRAPQNNADEAEDEPAFVNVLPDVTLQLWGGLLERRGYQITDGEIILSPSKVNGAVSEKKSVPSSPVRQEFGVARSVISSFRRANSFAPAVTAKEPASSRQLPFRRTSTSTAAFGKAGPSTTSPKGESSSKSDSASTPASQIFAGKRLRALGEAKSPAVRNAIEQLGGTMSTDEDEDVDFIIVRLVSGSKIYREEDDGSLRAKYRTECWLEQCIYEDRICAPEEQVSFVPLAIQIPVVGAEQVVLSMSGFDQSESHGLKRLLRALGITLAPTFTRQSTHLLCPSGTGLKFEKSREWGIPVINIHWLAAMASSGTIPQVHDFLVSGSTVPPLDGDQDMELTRKDLKGKGKAIDNGKDHTTPDDLNAAMDVDVQSRMNGITNNTSLEPHPNLPISPPSKKAKTIERQPTTLIPDPESPERFIFGMPNHTLGGSYIAHPSSICTPTRSLTSPVVQDAAQGSRQGSFMSRSGSLADDLHSNSFNASNPQRRNSSVNSDMERVDPDFRVPSSKSPSPMKIPWAGSRASLSPLKIDHKATKALQDSITSLLGKRPSEEGDESNGKKTKRGRPQRKPQSRQPSDAKIAESSTTTSKTRPKQVVGPPPAFADPAGDPFASYPDELDINNNGKSQEESMRVMYEDPGQREEKKRLMNLLKSQTGEESMSTLSGSRDFDRKTRRSARIAGF